MPSFKARNFFAQNVTRHNDNIKVSVTQSVYLRFEIFIDSFILQ